MLKKVLYTFLQQVILRNTKWTHNTPRLRVKDFDANTWNNMLYNSKGQSIIFRPYYNLSLHEGNNYSIKNIYDHFRLVLSHFLCEFSRRVKHVVYGSDHTEHLAQENANPSVLLLQPYVVLLYVQPYMLCGCMCNPTCYMVAFSAKQPYNIFMNLCVPLI